MARTSISRTIIKTICEVTYYDENNERYNETITVYGNYDIEHVTKPLSEIIGTNRLIVESIKHQSFYARMSMEAFAKLSDEKTNFKEW